MQLETRQAEPASSRAGGQLADHRPWFGPTRIQVAGWMVLVLFGVVQAWWTRHLIFSDGISYLDIADNYARGDWQHALNEYWSPLLSWILAIIFKLFRPSAYWQVSMLHATAFAAFCVALAGFEMFVGELLRDRCQPATGLSASVIRVAGYAGLFLAGLWHITLGQVSPDMLAMAILLWLAYLQLRIEAGQAHAGTYVLFGIGLALGFLTRSAFASILPLYIGASIVSLRLRRRPVLGPALLVCVSVIALAGPFVIALSVAKGHLTWGAAGAPNYAWEVDGAPRSVHWQGQPPDLGTPRHPTRKIFEHPAAYEFATPVSGTYPPWYEPSYWYAGIQPRFRPALQLRALLRTAPYFMFLFLASPIAIPCFALILAGNWRAWVSRQGIARYWFLLLPLLAYISLYLLVFLDKRYVGGPLVVLWTCLAASVRVSRPRLRQLANLAIPLLCVAFVAGYASVRMRMAFAVTLADALHGRESEWNLQWMMAERFRRLGVKSGDRVAFIGNAMDCEWARQLGARIVAEIPVIWNRRPGLSRVVTEDHAEPQAFWQAPPAIQNAVLGAFQRAGVSIVVADKFPAAAAAEGWRRVLPEHPEHMPLDFGSQFHGEADAGYLRIAQ